MKQLLAAVAFIATLASTPAWAEQRAGRIFEVAPFVGGLIATGHQRDLFDDAVLTGLTVSCDLDRHLAMVGSLAWAPTRTKALPLNDDIDLLQYDLGLQGQYTFDVGNGIAIKPFAGAGAGGRTYRFRDLDLNSETDFVGYFALGASAQFRSIAVGLTVRDHISGFDGIGLDDDDASAHHDIGVFASVGMRF